MIKHVRTKKKQIIASEKKQVMTATGTAEEVKLREFLVRVQEYCDKMRATGNNPEDIKTELRNIGWKEEQVEFILPKIKF